MITLVTGGARSGKSSFAESIFHGREDILYLATAEVTDREMEDRVKLHQISRPSSWNTYEGYRHLGDQVSKDYSGYLLDCITILCSRILFDHTAHLEHIAYEDMKLVEDEIVSECIQLIDEVRKLDQDLVLVTNEIGMGPVPMDPITRAFRDIQGRVNQRVAKLVDEVYLVVSGIEVKIK